ncbi:MAG: MBL fold metallo-hydrolase [Ruminococcaceae bacterium]|nr:MBL fold metallo-hydrolase [Oscillospiraceae bacterium]
MEEAMPTNRLERITDHIYALRIPYQDIFTTVYLVKAARGVLLFDAASYDHDIEDAVIPALDALGVRESDLKYVFISHNHTDHAGGLKRLLASYPNVCVVSKNEKLREKFAGYTFLSPEEGEVLLDDLSVVYVIGHTADSMTLYDRRTKTLLSGDCLQLWGIFGSGLWGANIPFFTQHQQDIQKLRDMDIDAIYTAHDYHPCGRSYLGKAQIMAALDACLAPFALLRQLIEEDPDADDETICQRYNADGARPTLAVRIVKLYREATLNACG